MTTMNRPLGKPAFVPAIKSGDPAATKAPISSEQYRQLIDIDKGAFTGVVKRLRFLANRDSSQHNGMVATFVDELRRRGLPIRPGKVSSSSNSVAAPPKKQNSPDFMKLLEQAGTDGVVDGSEMEGILKQCKTMSQEKMIEHLFQANQKGCRLTSRARALASQHVGGFEPIRLDDRIQYSRLDANVPAIELDRMLFDWSNGGLEPSLQQVAELKQWVQQAIVFSDNPLLVKTHLQVSLKNSIELLNRKNKRSKQVATQIQDVVSQLQLDTKFPAKTKVSRAVLEQGFTATEWQMAWKPKSWFGNDPLLSDFVGMLNDLIVDGKLENRDADYMIHYFEQFLPHPMFAWARPDSQFFKRQELEQFKDALASLPDAYVENGAKDKLQRWIDQQLEKAPQVGAGFAQQSQLKLKTSQNKQVSNIQDISNDPVATDHYLRMQEEQLRDSHELFFYGQQGYKPDDVLGDYALASESVKTFYRLNSSLFHNNIRRQNDLKHRDDLVQKSGGFLRNPQDELEKKLNPKVPLAPLQRTMPGSTKDRTNPIKVEQFVEMLTQVIHEESKNGLEPSLGTVHKWSPEFKKRYGKKFMPFTMSPKILNALAKGVSWKHMATGEEINVIKFMLKQPHQSISFDQLFRQSYRLNNGDVYLALLTLENVLAKHWQDPDREQFEIIQRLGPISNVGPDGDKYGSWYHLIGMMLFGYIGGALPAKFVGDVETLGSHVLNGFEDEWGENWVNHYGGDIGGQLRQVVEKDLHHQHQSNPETLSEDYYLRLSKV